MHVVVRSLTGRLLACPGQKIPDYLHPDGSAACAMCYGAGQMLDSPDARDFDVVTTQSSTV